MFYLQLRSNGKQGSNEQDSRQAGHPMTVTAARQQISPQQCLAPRRPSQSPLAETARGSQGQEEEEGLKVSVCSR